MLQKRSRNQFTGFSLGLLLSLVANCKHSPKVTVYVSDPHNQGMEFHNANTGESGFVSYDQTDKFICFTKSDFKILVELCEP